jgi:hypothetical protein
MERFIGNLNNPFMERVSVKNPLIIDNNKLLTEVRLLKNKDRDWNIKNLVDLMEHIVMCPTKTTGFLPELKYIIFYSVNNFSSIIPLIYFISINSIDEFITITTGIEC